MNLADVRVVPVVVLRDLDETIPTLTALRDGGIPAAEITFRTACAREALALAVKTFPDMLVGAGTVINADGARAAIAAGAKFVVSPGLSVAVFDVCRAANVPYIPGCATPTEIMQALDLGITTVKFFPASVYGGLAAVKALSAPFPQVKFLPTGGVDESNIRDFLACPAVVAVGGSFMMKGNIRENCKRVRDLIEQ